MSEMPLPDRPRIPTLELSTETLRLRTVARVQLVDLTERAAEAVRRSGVVHGMVNVQTRHTTTAVVVNEGEPLLHEDFHRLLQRLAPRDAEYRHDRTDLRTVNLVPGERPNGDAHARAILLGASETLNLFAGRIRLGRWQRIFLVELDGPRTREVTITVIGAAGPGGVSGRRGLTAVEPVTAEVAR